MDNQIEHIKQLAKEYFREIVSIRRHLHKHPELSFQEFKTSEFVCSVLDKHNISYTKGIVKTGIVAIIKGQSSSDAEALEAPNELSSLSVPALTDNSKVILLRADLDALPITETNDVTYKSQNAGIMHACGHDVHTASVLGTVIILNQLKHTFDGTVKIMFQPGEEVLPGGASLMIKEGVLTNPSIDVALAQHVFPSMEVGKVGFRSGMYMASTDELHVTITGKGGHAAMAGDYKNPIVVAAHIITEIEKAFPFTIDEEGVARHIKNNIPTVIAFGKIEAMGATNVIPEKAYLAGTFRTMDEKWREEVKEKLKQIIETCCEKYDVCANINIENGYPFLVNNDTVTEKAQQAAIDYLGKENVEELPLRMTAEDFAYITQQVPSCFYRLGTGSKQKGITSGVHTSTFDIDERALELSMGLMAWITLQELRN